MSRPRRLVPCLLLLGSLLIGPAQAAPTVANPKALAAKATAATPQEPPAVKVIASRYVEEADLDAYVASVSSVFSMRTRTTDPFGQLQDPDAKPIVKATVAKVPRRVAPVQATPFSDIVHLIKVTTVMPKDQCFLMGSRIIKQGDLINLAFRGKNLRVQVSAVSSRQIDFRNLENDETAALKLNVLPAGMTPGSRGITAPGMLPNRQDSVIELDPGNTPTDKSQSR